MTFRDVDHASKCGNGYVSLRDIRQILDEFCNENRLPLNDPKAIAAARFMVSLSEDDLSQDDMQAVLRQHFAGGLRSVQPHAYTNGQHHPDGNRYRVA